MEDLERKTPYVYRSEGRVVGVAALQIESEETGKLHWVYVLPEHQRKGIGTALVIHLEREGREIGLVFRPGVSARVVNAAEAVELVGRALESEPRIRVAGIAGPGEPLANAETFATLQAVHERFPDLILCLSSNGLLLSRHAQSLAALGVKTITVTVNSVNPIISARIYSFVNYDHRRLEGMEAAELLLRRQLRGIEAAVEAGMLVKVNTVLIPGLNDHHLVEVSSEVARRGAWIQNIMPLIPLGDFRHRRPPTCDELRTAREAGENFLPQFRHCKQCRADAVGVPGDKYELPGR